MRMKLSEEENNVCKEYIKKLLIDECELNKYEDEIKDRFEMFLSNNENIFSIVNDFFVEESEYEYFKVDNNEYLNNHLKEMLFRNIDKNSLYHPIINDDDMQFENFVKNGTLVLKFDRVINFALESIIRIEKTLEIEDYMKKIEKSITKKIGIATRILFNDISIYEE